MVLMGAAAHHIGGLRETQPHRTTCIYATLSTPPLCAPNPALTLTHGRMRMQTKNAKNYKTKSLV
jgi:hypothetical protein